MSLLRRTYPYGTKKSVVVKDVRRCGSTAAAICIDDGSPARGFVVLQEREELEGVAVDDRGTITFVEGGPTGGYWFFEKG